MLQNSSLSHNLISEDTSKQIFSSRNNISPFIDLLMKENNVSDLYSSFSVKESSHDRGMAMIS